MTRDWHKAHQKPLTPEEEAAVQAAAATFLTRLVAVKCTVCGGPIENEVQVGHCVYVEPCGHRDRQGHVRDQFKTPRKKKS